MEHARLGRTGLQVSKLCLGTMTFGLQSAEPAAVAILDRAAEGGIDDDLKRQLDEATHQYRMSDAPE